MIHWLQQEIEPALMAKPEFKDWLEKKATDELTAKYGEGSITHNWFFSVDLDWHTYRADFEPVSPPIEVPMTDDEEARLEYALGLRPATPDDD